MILLPMAIPVGDLPSIYVAASRYYQGIASALPGHVVGSMVPWQRSCRLWPGGITTQCLGRRLGLA
eukprot:2112569-Rhodomonas_salina.1